MSTEHETLEKHAGYFNTIFAPNHLVALGNEYAEAATGKDSLLVEYMRECIDNAITIVKQHPHTRGYTLDLGSPGRELHAVLTATTVPHLNHSLRLTIKPSVMRGQNVYVYHGTNKDVRLPGYTASLELRLRENDDDKQLPMEITPRNVGKRKYALPEKQKEYASLFLGLNVPEKTTARIPMISEPAKGFYTDEDESKECSKTPKEQMTSFLKTMLSYKPSWPQWRKQRKNTATKKSSRRQ